MNNFGPNQAALELIQAQLAEVGVDIELKSATGTEFTQNIGAGGLRPGVGQPQPGRWRRAAQLATPRPATNYYKVNDPQLETLLQQQAAIADPDAPRRGARPGAVAHRQPGARRSRCSS